MISLCCKADNNQRGGKVTSVGNFSPQVWPHNWNLGWRSWSSILLAVLTLKVSLWLSQIFLLYFYLFTSCVCHFSFVNMLLENLFVALYLCAFSCVFSCILLMTSLHQPQFTSLCCHRLCRVCSNLNLSFITEVIFRQISWRKFTGLYAAFKKIISEGNKYSLTFVFQNI